MTPKRLPSWTGDGHRESVLPYLREESGIPEAETE